MCVRMLRRRRATRQRDPLTVPMVKALEEYLNANAATGSPMTVMASTTLFAVYTRTRIGDLRRCTVEPVVELSSGGSVGYLETKFHDHKTAKPASTRALPIAAPVHGLTGSVWGVKYVLARKSAGTTADDGSCLVPAVAEGGILNAPYTTNEFSIALRSLLCTLGFSEDEVKNIGAHSLKATVLSWAAKYGMEKDHRRLLGYHVAAGDRSADTYARELLAAPLRSMSLMLAKIRDNKFDPDATKSGYFAAGTTDGSLQSGTDGIADGGLFTMEIGTTAPTLSSGTVPYPVPQVLSTATSTASASGSTSSSTSTSARKLIQRNDDGCPTCIRNKATGYVHLAFDEVNLVCGKVYPHLYETIDAPREMLI